MRALRIHRGDRKAAGGCALALRCGGRRLRRRLRCGARVSVAPHNSLRSLRSLRSNRCGESVDEARAYARRPKPSAPRRRTGAPARTRPRLCEAAWFLVGERPQPGIEPGWRLHARLRRAASHGLDARGLPFTHTPRTAAPRKAAGGAQAGRMAPPRRRARTQTVQWTVCAWRAAGRLRPARPARPGLRSARVPARFVI